MGYWEQIGAEQKRNPRTPRQRLVNDFQFFVAMAAFPALLGVIAWIAVRLRGQASLADRSLERRQNSCL